MTTILAFIAVGCMVYFTIGIEIVTDKYVNKPYNSDPWTKFMEIYGQTTASFYTILALVMLMSYIFLKVTLNRYAHSSLNKPKKVINFLFAALVVCYLLRAAILDG